MRYAIYIRKSSESEDRQAKSIEDQLNELKELASKLELNVVKTFTESQSAKKVGRPVFNEMFKFVSGGKADAILVWKADRLARNPVDGGSVIYALGERQIKEIRSPYAVYTGTSNDKFMLSLEFGMSTKYSDDLSDNVTRGMKTTLEGGLYPNKAPLGYIDKGKGRKVIDKKRSSFIKRAYEMRATGDYTYVDIQEILEKEGFRNKRGLPVSRTGISFILRHPFYAGYSNYGRRGGSKVHGTFQLAHEPIIPKSLFDKVQALGGDTAPKNQEKMLHFFLLRGKVYCSLCQEICYPELIKRKYRYYRCRTKGCPQKCVSEPEIDKYLQEELKHINFSDADMEKIRVIIKKKVHIVSQSRRKKFSQLQKELTEVKGKMINLLEERVGGSLDEETYRELQNQLTLRKESIKQTLAGFEVSDDEIIKDVESFFELARSAYNSYKFFKEEKRAGILKRVLSNLYVSGDRFKVSLNDEFNEIYKTSLKARGANGASWWDVEDSNLRPFA